MKKFFLLALATFGIVAFAQAQVKVGAHLGYGTKAENLLLGVNAEFFINEKLAIAPDFSYYLPKKEAGVSSNWMEFNGNAHYYFYESGSLKVYGLGGVNYTRWSVETPSIEFMGNKIGGGTVSDGKVGVNIGAGVGVGISDNLEAFGSLKYVIISDVATLVPHVGIRYKF